MPDAERKLTPDKLRDRWRKEPGISFRKQIIRQLKSDKTEHRVDWDHLNVTANNKAYLWKVFIGINEIYENNIPIRDLRGIELLGENLKNVDLSYTYMNYAYLSYAHLEHADLRSANLEHANLIGAHLEHADLYDAHLEHANLRYAHMEKTDLTDAHFTLKSWWRRVKESFWNSKFIRFVMKKLKYDYSIWESPNRPILLEGAELKNVNLDSDPVLYRELLDEQYLDRFKQKHKILYPFWLLTSNCGRSISLVFLWSLIIIVIFGFIYSPLYLKYSSLTVDKICWWHPFYFSFVTMTTLGMASVEPGNFQAAFWHTIQNLFGYVWLGYLIAVLGSKLTRRSA